MGTILGILILVAVIAAVAYLAIKERKPAPPPQRKPAPAPPKTFPIATPGGPKAPPSHGPHLHADPAPAPPPPPSTDLSRRANDKVGEPEIARRVSLFYSQARVIPDNKLFKPGDECVFEARIVDENQKPIEGIPVFFRNESQRRDMTDAFLTDADGYARARYTVTDQDQIPAGSYLVRTYAGGRAILQRIILHDALFLPGEEPSY